MWALFLPGLLLLLVAALELYGRLRPGTRIRFDRTRRTPWDEVPVDPGERRWRCALPFTNHHRTDQGLLVAASAEVRWLTFGGRATHSLTGRATVVLRGPEGRRDGYFAAGTVEPGDTVLVDMEVTASGSETDLKSLLAGVVTLSYRVYTRHSDEQHQAEILLSAGVPSGAPGARREGATLLQPVLTHLLTEDDDIVEVVTRYISPLAAPGDLVVLVESAVAIAQGRYYSPSEIKPGWLARRLCHFFPLKGSLGTQFTLQALMNEHGTLRVLFAAAVGTAGKLFGLQGLFYRLAGDQARLIDDLSGTLPPFDRFIVMGPADPANVVREIAERTGLAAAVVDANDGNEAYVLAASPSVDVQRLTQLMRMNPQGNDDQQTPLVLVRWSETAEHAA